MGLGEAGFFVGATTMITDLAPDERRGEAVSYWSVALWGGLAFGPVLGRAAARRLELRPRLVRGRRPRAHGRGRRVLHQRDAAPRPRGPRSTSIAPAAIRPGVILAATLIGITGFSIFLPLYAPEVGVDDVGLALPHLRHRRARRAHLRRQAARHPRPDPRRDRSRSARPRSGSPLLAVWQSTAGLFVATIVIAVGSSFLYPSMLLLALRGVPENQRGSVVGTFSAFFDFASGASGISLGGVAAASSYPGAFGASAGLAADRVGAAAERLRPARLRGAADGGRGRDGIGRTAPRLP